MRENFLYQPYYCEENVWHLAKQLNERHEEQGAEVWFIINQNQTVLTAQQKAVDANELIVWDYHVIYYSPEKGVYDLDTRCPFPYSADRYLQESFPDIPELPTKYNPYFRAIGAKEYISIFSSSRKHMLDEEGCYLHAPPSWPCIGKGHNLDAFTDFNNTSIGNLYSLDELRNLLII